MNFETKLNEIQEELKTGQVAPNRLAEMKDWLAGMSSSLIEEQSDLTLEYAQYFNENRPKVKSDKALKQAWLVSQSGVRELQLETAQRRIKVLVQAISSHLRVAHDEAYNRV